MIYYNENYTPPAAACKALTAKNIENLYKAPFFRSACNRLFPAAGNLHKSRRGKDRGTGPQTRGKPKKRAAEFVALPICMRQYPPLSRLRRIRRGFPAAHGAHIPAQRAPHAVRRAEKQRAEHERLRQKLLFRAEKAARNRKFTFRTRKILEISAFCVILKLTRTGGFVPQAPAATRIKRDL